MHRERVVAYLAGAAAVVVTVWIVSASGVLQALPFFGTPEIALSAQERHGQTLYEANCDSCHGGRTGGSMMDYPPRHNASGHTWHHPDCELLQVVRDGGDEMTRSMRDMMAPPGAPQMQAFKDRLSDDEIRDVLAFIKTMWTPEQRRVQSEITSESCPP